MFKKTNILRIILDFYSQISYDIYVPLKSLKRHIRDSGTCVSVTLQRILSHQVDLMIP